MSFLSGVAVALQFSRRAQHNPVPRVQLGLAQILGSCCLVFARPYFHVISDVPLNGANASHLRHVSMYFIYFIIIMSLFYVNVSCKKRLHKIGRYYYYLHLPLQESHV